MDSNVHNEPGDTNSLLFNYRYIIVLLRLFQRVGEVLPLGGWGVGGGGTCSKPQVGTSRENRQGRKNGFVCEPQELQGSLTRRETDGQAPKQHLSLWSRHHLSHWAATPIQRHLATNGNGTSEPSHRNSHWGESPLPRGSRPLAMGETY